MAQSSVFNFSRAHQYHTPHTSTSVMQHSDSQPVILMPTPLHPLNISQTHGPLSILIADDNNIIRRLMTGMLRRLGYGCSVITGKGLEAVEAVASENYDLIILDLYMPHMDGMTAAQIIAQNRFGSRPRIVAMTNEFTSPERAMRADPRFEKRFDRVLTKPVGLRTLTNVIAEACVAKRKARGPSTDFRGRCWSAVH